MMPHSNDREANDREANDLASFLDKVRSNADQLAPSERDKLETYLGEVIPAWKIISPSVQAGSRVLEIGAGIGALSNYVAHAGAVVVSLEPFDPGFEENEVFWKLVFSSTGDSGRLTRINGYCEELVTQGIEPFDFIYSNHVLEHVEDINALFAALSKLLKPSGKMIHICPNYRFPYEPHFKVPFLINKDWTRRLFLRSLDSNDSLWKNLNCIKSTSLKKYCKTHHFTLQLQPEVLADNIARAMIDQRFQSRHKAAFKLVRWLKVLGVLPLIRKLPASWASPMIAEIRHK